MSVRECSECGVVAPTFVWGLSLLVRDGWDLATQPHSASALEAAPHAWLCSECRSRGQRLSAGVGRAIPAPAEPFRTRRSPQPRVLVIDDQVLMLRSMGRLLSGYETVLADGPGKALSLLKSGMQFEALVCDVMMPDMTGPELYVRCCELYPEFAERFVFTSADPITARRMIDQSAAQVGARRLPPLLAKPTSRELLMEALARVVTEAAHRSGTYRMQLVGDASDSSPSRSAPDNSLPKRESSAGTRRSSY